MTKLTGKEKAFIVKYADDFIELLDKEKSSIVSDGQNSFNEEEIITIKEKVIEM